MKGFRIIFYVITIAIVGYAGYFAWDQGNKFEEEIKRLSQLNTDSSDKIKQKDSLLQDSGKDTTIADSSILQKFHSMESTFDKAMLNQKEKKEQLLQRLGKREDAMLIRATADSFYNYIESFQNDIIKKQAFNIHSISELQEMILKTRKRMLPMVKNSVKRNGIHRGSTFSNMDTEYLKPNFEHAPLAGVIVMLRKIENDCMEFENSILLYLAEQ